MKRHDDDVEQVLTRLLRSTPRQQMEGAGVRVLERLRREGNRADTEIALASSRRTLRVFVVAAAIAATVVVAIILWPGGSVAVVEAADNGLFRMVQGKPEPLRIGEKVALGEIIRSDGESSATLAVADGSRIEMRSMSELALENVKDGLSIRLHDGSVVVSAPKDAKVPLVVRTRDATVSVVNTVSLVTAEKAGSRVAVFQGEARLQQGGGEKWLRSGDEATTNPSMKRLKSWKEEVSWSRLATRGASSRWPQQPAAQAVPEAKPGVPKWEVVSIKPCDPNSTNNVPGARGNNGAGENFTVTPGRLSVTCMRVALLTNLAYVRWGEPLTNSTGLERDQLIKGPDWIQSGKLSDRYSIEAKAEGTPDRDTIMGPMLRALLEDRFQLRTHREFADSPTMALVVANNGLKIKPINEAECTPNDQAGGEVWADQVHRGEMGFCGFLYGQDVSPTVIGWAFGGHTMAALAGILSRSAHRPVVDQTGVAGKFRFYLEVAKNEPFLSPNPFDLQPPRLPVPNSGAPDIFTAIREQLGLQVVDAPKGSYQYIKVDQVERPSEN